MKIGKTNIFLNNKVFDFKHTIILHNYGPRYETHNQGIYRGLYIFLDTTNGIYIVHKLYTEFS